MSQQDYNIRVVCRLRPLNKIEIAHGGECCVKYTDKTVQIAVGGDENKYEFAFDRIFGTDTRQVSIYEEVAKPIINAVVSGFNGTVFAYGQTGGGKTWTMEGPNHDDVQLKGLIPRMMEGLFEKVESFDPSYEFTIKCSYIQIYNEKIFDLLDPSKNKLEIKEDKQRGIFIQDCTEVYVASVNEMRNTMKNGSQNRKIAFTGMNQRSSRSHSLFIVQVGQKDTKKGNSKNAKLYFVDLAGSQKVSKTGVSGVQLEEAKNINKSLSCLGNVINALTSEKKEHVPYRDSKLTRILQESLGGNSKTTLIINCSICSYNDKETLGTLRFGYRAKSIKNKPTVNEERSAKQLQVLLDKANKTIFELTQQLKLGGNKSQIAIQKPIPLANEQRQALEKKIQELQSELDSKLESSLNISAVNDLQTRIKQLLLQNKMQAEQNQQQLEVVIEENKKYLETIQIFFIKESNLEKLLKRLKTDLNFLLLNLKYDDNRKESSNKDLEQKTFGIIQIIIKDIEDYLEHIRTTHEKYLQQPKTDSNHQNSVQLSSEIINKFKSKIEVTMSQPNLHEDKFQKNFEEISCIIKERLNEDSLSDEIKGEQEESSTEFQTLIDSISKEGEQKMNKLNIIKQQKFTIEELKKQIKALNATIEELTIKNEGLAGEYKKKQLKLQEVCQKRLQEAALQIEAVVNKNKAQKEEIKKLESQKANANKLEAQHNALIEKYKKIVENNGDLAERMKLEQKSKEYANERQKLFNEMYQLRDQLDEVEITLKEKDDLIESLKTTMKETYESMVMTQKPIYMSPQVVQKQYESNFLGIQNKNVVKTIKGGKHPNPAIITTPPPSQEIKKSVLRNKLLGQDTKQGKGLMQIVKNFFS